MYQHTHVGVYLKSTMSVSMRLTFPQAAVTKYSSCCTSDDTTSADPSPIKCMLYLIYPAEMQFFCTQLAQSFTPWIHCHISSGIKYRLTCKTKISLQSRCVCCMIFSFNNQCECVCFPCLEILAIVDRLFANLVSAKYPHFSYKMEHPIDCQPSCVHTCIHVYTCMYTCIYRYMYMSASLSLSIYMCVYI